MKLKILLLFICNVTLAYSQWEAIKGPGSPTSILNQNGNLICGTDLKGIYVLEKDSVNWYPLQSTLGIRIFDIDTLQGYLIASTNRGIMSFNESEDYFSFDDLNEYYCLTRTSGNIFAGSANGKIFKSINGVQWEQAAALEYPILSITSDGEQLYAINSNDELLISSDEGGTWKSTSTGVEDIYDMEVNGNNIYIATAGDGALYSTSRGRNWEKFTTQLNEYEVRDILIKDIYIFIATPSGVFFTFNEGQSWQSLSDGLLDKETVCLGIDKEYLYAGCKFGGFFRCPLNKIFNPDVKPPALELPLDKAKIFDTTTVFRWQSSAGALYYTFQASFDSTFNEISISTDKILKNTFECTELKKEKKYFWRIGASGNDGTPSWSEFRILNVYDEKLTEAPLAKYPIKGEKVYIHYPTIQFYNSERALEMGIEIFYEDQLYEAANIDPIDSLIVEHKMVNRIYPNQEYKWVTFAMNRSGTRIYSDTSLFYGGSYLLAEENDEEDLKVYPNPADEYIILPQKNNFRIIEIKLYDLTGREVKKWSGGESRLYIGDVTKGAYSLLIKTERKANLNKVLLR